MRDNRKDATDEKADTPEHQNLQLVQATSEQQNANTRPDALSTKDQNENMDKRSPKSGRALEIL